MAIQNMNVEIIPKLQECQRMLEEELIKDFEKVTNDLVETAEYLKIPKIEANCKKCEEGSHLVLASLNAINDAISTYLTDYKKFAETTGAEY